MSRRWRVPGRIASALMATAALGLASAGPAAADTTIGQTRGDQGCVRGFVAADPSDQIPAGGGVITSFSYGDDGNNAGKQLDFEVLSPAGGGSYTVLGHTGLQTLAGVNGVETFSAHIPVSGGEILGYYETGAVSGPDNCLDTASLGDVLAYGVTSDPTTGTTLSGAKDIVLGLRALNLSANLAPNTGPAPLTATGSTLSATEGQQLNGAVATFTDADAQTADAYTATINWGDNSSSAGTVLETSPGQYEVDGSHTYAEATTDAVGVQITDADGTSVQVSSTAAVADAALSATGLGSASPVLSTPSFSGAVANLTDANLLGSTGDFTATVDWGDGTTSQATVAGSGGNYTVRGSHVYGADGPYTVQVHIADQGGSTADATTNLLVYEYADGTGGSFVIGDAGTTGAQVEFWGPQWAAQNPLSGGGAPRSFKGFASSSAQSCGATFAARPGNSSAPPAAVPAYTAVAVTGSVTKSGSQISGTVEKVVVVKTDPGYGPQLDSPGTGEVVATVCG